MSMWNTVPMRPLTTPKPFNAWGVATLAYLLGKAVLFGIGLVVGWAGFLVMSAMGLVGAGSDLTVDDLMVVAVAVAVALTVLSLAIQARFIANRGGARPVAATVAALVAGLLVGLAATATGLPEGLFMVLSAAVEIAVLATLIKPRP